ncbi:MAG: hypothetical protein WBE91_12610 [Steroidobacteraceae bacterium]
MKIAILNQPQDPIAAAAEQRGSVAIVNWELARCLANRHEVIVYAPRVRGQAERLERLYGGLLAAQPGSPWSAAAAERARSIDVA